jgi:hypothetical protein
MDATTMVWIGFGAIALQGVFVLALLIGIRSFGAYTQANVKAVLEAHEENMATARENANTASDLAHLRAQLYAERAALASRRQPPQSEEVVA